LIEVGLLFLARRIAVIGDTAPGGLLLAMGFPAAKRTTQVATSGIARISQEENAAVLHRLRQARRRGLARRTDRSSK